MPVREFKKNLFSIGSIDWDRRLFDELIPLPDGTSYNSYIVKGSNKTALLDAVDPEKKEELFRKLKKMGLEKIDYIVSHHAEQDHSGTIPDILEAFPEARVLASPKCKEQLMALLHIADEKIDAVEDGSTISLGDKSLTFHHVPWVHWPDTMATYVQEDKVLFSCDFFGSHYATSELFVEDESKIYIPAKRYYAEIMMPFSKMIKNNLEKVSKLDIEIIAPSHGPMHKNPSFIIDAYRDWSSDKVKNEVIIPYVSMHGSTSRMVDYFSTSLMEKGINIKPFNLSTTDIGDLAMSLLDAATIVVGTSTVLVGPHPQAVYAVYLANALRPKTKFASIICSYGWGSKAIEQIIDMLGNFKGELIDPVKVKGYPRESDYQELDRLAEEIHKKHQELGL